MSLGGCGGGPAVTAPDVHQLPPFHPTAGRLSIPPCFMYKGNPPIVGLVGGPVPTPAVGIRVVLWRWKHGW